MTVLFNSKNKGSLLAIRIALSSHHSPSIAAALDLFHPNSRSSGSFPTYFPLDKCPLNFPNPMAGVPVITFI